MGGEGGTLVRSLGHRLHACARADMFEGRGNIGEVTGSGMSHACARADMFEGRGRGNRREVTGSGLL